MPETAAQVAMQVMDKTREMGVKTAVPLPQMKSANYNVLRYQRISGQDSIEGVFERADRHFTGPRAMGGTGTD